VHRLALVIALASGVLVAAPAASARPTLTCKAADLRYAFVPGGAKNFGVFKLTVTGGTCATARRVAKTWMTRFEASIRSGSATPPRSAAGFTFTTLPTTAAQTYRERGRRGTTSIRFDYRVPNG
jgi:curli biogenesis system outer membrane secretion channel CsgG